MICLSLPFVVALAELTVDLGDGIAGKGIAALQPAAHIDLGAALRAERPMGFCGRLAADRTARSRLRVCRLARAGRHSGSRSALASPRRPTATTVSAASRNDLAYSGSDLVILSAASALARARRRTIWPVSYTHLRAHETDSYL